MIIQILLKVKSMKLKNEYYILYIQPHSYESNILYYKNIEIITIVIIILK